jgi:hypothetical protein
MENKVKFCVVCGRRIPELSLRKTTCSKFCYKRRKSGFAPFLNCEFPPYKDLTDYQKEAQKKGMSYGQYVASLANTERKDKNNG